MAKIIIDAEEQDMSQALNAVFQIQVSNPDQQVGQEFSVKTMVNGKDFEVIRNLNSYTIRATQ